MRKSPAACQDGTACSRLHDPGPRINQRDIRQWHPHNRAQVLNPGDTVAFGEGIVLLFDVAEDANATVLSAKAPPTAVQRPAPAPAPMPAPAPIPAPVRPPAPAPAPVRPPAPAVVPTPAYSGQVPAGPVPMPPATAPKKKKKFPVWLIIVIILLVIICVCAGFFLLIDQLNLWCKVLPFLVPLLGGTCA